MQRTRRSARTHESLIGAKLEVCGESAPSSKRPVERIVSHPHIRGDKLLAGTVMAGDATRHDFRCRERPCRSRLNQFADAKLFPAAGMIELDSCRLHGAHLAD